MYFSIVGMVGETNHEIIYIYVCSYFFMFDLFSHGIKVFLQFQVGLSPFLL